MTIDPSISAIMCDGMGWFNKEDYKRMLLAYDKIYYLLPEYSTEFMDIDGSEQWMHFPVTLKTSPLYKITSFLPNDQQNIAILTTARQDIIDSKFINIFENIPINEQIYTWRVTNSDPALGHGKSLCLSSNEVILAQAILLNKFLLAADNLDCIPITGTSYIHQMILEKYRMAVNRTHDVLQLNNYLPPDLKRLSCAKFVEKLFSELIPSTELITKSEYEILTYKEKNHEIFLRYCSLTRNLVERIKSNPFETGINYEIDVLMNSDIWKEKIEVETELRSIWTNIFKSAIISSSAGIVGLGIAPFLSLNLLAISGLLVGSIPWAISEFIKVLDSKNRIQKNGLYYILSSV